MSELIEKAAQAAKETYQAIEDAVVGAYKKVEDDAVDAYEKTEEFFVDKLFRKEGETVEEAKDRLKDHK